MLSERGWAVAGAGLSLLVLWALFGEIELGVAGVLLVTGALAALVFVTVHRPSMTLSRRIESSEIHEGDHAGVSLLIANGDRPARHVNITDEVARLGTAEFAVGTLAPHERITAAYRVLCRPRGVYTIGPTLVDVTDPMGLASRKSTSGPADSLVVYPAVEKLSGFPAVRGHNQSIHAQRPEHSLRGGEDFYTMREYQHGDDLRRVHWPSSARRDQLMIRQLETPWQARALVVLDVRSESFESEECFEHAVRAAASVVRHLSSGGFDADLWTGGNLTDAAHQAAAMRSLATVEPVDGLDMSALGSALRRTRGGGALVLIGGNPDQVLLGLQRILAPEFPTTVLMSASTATSSTLLSFQRAGVVSVVVPPARAWAPEWASAMRNSWHTISAG
ncbi:hypothetical protein BH23ACT5_BH23ACT5_11610 [soil metagenome]